MADRLSAERAELMGTHPVDFSVRGRVRFARAKRFFRTQVTRTMRLNIHFLPIILIILVLLFFAGETRMQALSQCKVDWMNHPAGRDDKSSGSLTSSDYLAACMESHGYRHRLACLATPDSESCYDPTSFPNKLRSMVE
jgi:hypothetical protein